MTENILVPLDGSEKSFDALAYAIENWPEAEITVVHALDFHETAAVEGSVIVMDEQIRQAAENRAEEIFAEARELAADLEYGGELDTVLEEGGPKRVIVDHAGEFDAVVMGTYGREGTGQKLLGSVAETVVRRSPTTTMVVK